MSVKTFLATTGLEAWKLIPFYQNTHKLVSRQEPLVFVILHIAFSYEAH